MSKRQPKLKLPAKLALGKIQPEVEERRTELVPGNLGDLALRLKYIKLILTKWIPGDPSELLEISNWKAWIASCAKQENEVDLFSDKKVHNSFAGTLVELICDEDQRDPWRHKLLCSKLNDQQMAELSKLIGLREERECAKLLEKACEDNGQVFGDRDEEEMAWSPVVDPEAAILDLETKYVRKEKKLSEDLIFADCPIPKVEKKRKKKVKLPKKPAKEVSRDISMVVPAAPPNSPPSPPQCKPSYNDDVLELEMGRLAIARENLKKKKDEERRKVIALKYPRPPSQMGAELELTPEMFEMFEKALQRGSEECLVEFAGLKYKREDLAVMNDGREWLNDRNIDFYLELIRDRANYLQVYVFHCFFYKMLADRECSFDVLRDATGEEDLTKFDLVFWPVNLSDHWRLVVADFGERKLKCFDSLGAHPVNEEILKTILSYLKREYQRRNTKGHLTFFRGWTLENVEKESIPQQGNFIDCGVFLLQFAEYLSRGLKHFDFEQKHVPYFRKKMMYETLTKRILSPSQQIVEKV